MSGVLLLKNKVIKTDKMFAFIKNIIALFYNSRKCCLVGKNSVFYKTSNIANNLGIKDKIRIGNYCHIKGELLLFGHGGYIELGDYCYVGDNTHIWSAKKITLGNRVLISHNCNIFDNDTHPLEVDERHKQFIEIITRGHPKKIDLREKEVIIEDDVLIAANSTILKGVRIGKGAVIGAGSVVTKDVPAFTVVAGNPATIIRYLTREQSHG